MRAVTVGVVVGVLAALGTAVPASAAVEFVDAPTRLYMLPNADGPLPAPIPFPLVPDGVLEFDDSQDLISQDLRKIEVISEDPDCVFGEDYDLTGCTAVQLDVGHGLLDFTTDPTRIEYDAENDGSDDDVVYELPGGALVRDMDSDDDLPALATAVIGTTDQVNAALDLLRYTPDQDYYYEGFNPETLSVDIVPGSGSGSVTHDIDIRVQDLNDFPEADVPQTVYDVAPGGEVVLAPADTWEVTDDDNDEPDGDETVDGPGEEFIVIAWSSCGYFHFQGASGMALRDDLEELIEYALDLDPGTDPAWRQTIVDAFLAIVPDDIESLPFATGNPNEYATAFAGVVDDLQWLNYHLDEITFAAVSDPVAMTPLADSLCDVRFLVTDIGNNGLPLQYLGDPPEGVEVPFFGFDVDTNDVPGVELVQVQVGDGEEIQVALGDETVPEGSTGAVTATITPAEHPAFELTVSTADGPDAVAGSDYTAQTDQVIVVPEDAATVDIPVDALQDTEYEQPDETYQLTATGPAADPPGYQITMTDASAAVTIDDDDPEPDTTAPTATLEQAAGQIDPATTLAPVLFTVQFDEPVTGFDGNADVALAFSGTGTPVATIVPVDGDTYTVSVSGMTSGGVLTADVVAGAAEDAAGNASASSTSTDNEVTITLIPVDDVDPTVTVDQALGQADPVMTLDPIVFTVAFDESVTGFTGPADVDLAFTGAGTVSAMITPLDAQTYTVAVAGFTGPGVLTATVPAGAAVDLSGNPNAASTSTDNSVTVVAPPDDVEPTVTIDQAPGQADPATTLGPIAFAVAFDEGVTGFDALADLGLAFSGSGTLAATITAVDSATYTVAVSGFTSEGVLTATVLAGAAQDLAGNPSAASTSTDNTVTIGLPQPVNDPPVLTIDPAVETEPGTSVGITASVADPDVAAGLMELEIDVSPIGGSVTADGTFTWPHGADITTDVFVGTLAQVNAALADLSFTPGAGQTGIARVVVEIDDQGNTGTGGVLSDTGFTLITIAAEGDDDPDVNDPPVLTLPATLATTVDTPVAVPGSATDPDVGAGLMELEVEVAAIAGPVTADGAFTWPHGTDVTTDVFVGTLAEVNAALAGLEFTPGAGLVGTARLVIEIDDQGNSGSGGELSHTDFVDILIEADPVDPLAIDVPDDIVVHALPGEPGIAVAFEDATASGGVPPYTIVCDHATGDYFPVGATTVTCTAEDSAPEEDVVLFAVVSASFTITVIAVDAPDDPGAPGTPGQPSVAGPDGLSATGADPSSALMLAAALLLGGLVALRVSRRVGRGRG
ncbi:hypothetical protein OB08_00445 [Microbacterium sp. HJ5]